MTMKQIFPALAAALLLAACSAPASQDASPSAGPAEDPPAASQGVSAGEEGPSSSSDSPESSLGGAIQDLILDESGGKNPSSCGVPIYYGTEGQFQVYKGSCLSQPTPEDLVAALAQLTGWDLTLAQPVEILEDGYSLVFTQDCSLVVGPPDPQKEEFHVYDQAQLVQTALDSIRQTLRVQSLADGFQEPDQVQIYVRLEGDRELSSPDNGFRVPMDQPYDGLLPL